MPSICPAMTSYENVNRLALPNFSSNYHAADVNRCQRRYSSDDLRMFLATQNVCDLLSFILAYRDTSHCFMRKRQQDSRSRGRRDLLLPETRATSFITLMLTAVYKPPIRRTITHRRVSEPLGIQGDLSIVVRHHHVSADLHLAVANVDPDLQRIWKTE